MPRAVLLIALGVSVRLLGQESKTVKPEIDVLYEQDQNDRQEKFTAQNLTPEFVLKHQTEDAARRQRVYQLLVEGTLQTGKDFEEAAFIFQHGDKSDDQLLGHILAMVAVKKGNTGAIWIAAATLDRYLQRIGQPQISGTQFGISNAQPWTQEPYNRNLISDSLRQELAVPALGEQASQLAEMNKPQSVVPK